MPATSREERVGGADTPPLPPPETSKLSAQPENEPDDEVEMPGTPPITPQSMRAWGQSQLLAGTSETREREQAKQFADEERKGSAELRERRQRAAMVAQRGVRCFLARRSMARRLSAVGRPVELRVAQITGLELLCDFRNVVSVYCNVRVLKKPFGPFMFHFSTGRCTNVHLPTWPDDSFFVPMLSSKCDLVTTLIGVTTGGRLRFLGQAVAPLEPGWEHQRSVEAALGKWKFPVDESIVGLHRFVPGTVELELTPISSRLPCKSGQFLMAPPISTRPRRSFSLWSRQVSTAGVATSPHTPRTPASASPSPSRRNAVTRWGVLTDTFFHLFDHSSAKLLVSLDLAKLQLIQSSAQQGRAKSDPSRLFPVKIYSQGTMYVLFVSSYAQQQSWEYKINLHRRQLLIP